LHAHFTQVLLFRRQICFKAAHPAISLFLLLMQRPLKLIHPAFPQQLLIGQCLLALLGPFGAPLYFSL
jgi:hypothetical protein